MPEFLTEAELKELLRLRCEEEGSQGAFAFKFNLDRSLICNILSGNRPLTLPVAKVLGYTRSTVYVRCPDADKEKQ